MSECRWTGERCNQIHQLSHLLSLITSLNRGTSFIEHFQAAEDLAESLNSEAIDGKTFISFLSDEAITERKAFKDANGRLPE